MKKMILWEDGPTLIQAEHAPMTTDTVVLADFAGIREEKSGADLGCASGALMLILMTENKTLRMTGFELNGEASELAVVNLQENGLSDRGAVVPGDLRETAAALPEGMFDFVIANPPYYTVESGPCSPNSARASAYAETDCTLEEVCRAARHLCRSRGSFFVSWRPERLGELLSITGSLNLEIKRLRFVHYSAARPAAIVLAEGRKDGRPGLRVEAPLILHDPDGRESAEYRRICRLGK